MGGSSWSDIDFILWTSILSLWEINQFTQAGAILANSLRSLRDPLASKFGIALMLCAAQPQGSQVHWECHGLSMKEAFQVDLAQTQFWIMAPTQITQDRPTFCRMTLETDRTKSETLEPGKEMIIVLMRYFWSSYNVRHLCASSHFTFIIIPYSWYHNYPIL